MSNSTNVNTVSLIGKGARLTETAVPAVVALAPEGFDPNKRGAVAALVIEWACGDGPVPAQKRGPKGEQVVTDFGRGVDTLTRAVKRALAGEDDSPKPITLRATLSGEGGGSVTIPTDHALYAVLVEMIRGEQGEQSDAA